MLANRFSALAPDVIHLNKQNLEDGLDLLLAAERTRLPTVCTIHVTRRMAGLGSRFAGVRDWIAPSPAIAGSWWTTTMPSDVTCTSSSTASAPSSTARWNAARVFSGRSREAPRWATISGMVTSQS